MEVYKTNEEENEKKACVEARVYELSNGKYRLKVWNSGNVSAHNVTARFNEDSKIILMDREKMPFEILEPQKSFELVIVIYNSSARKFTITTEWEDEKGEKQSKTQMGDL